MNVSNIPPSDPVQLTQGVEAKRMQLQMLLLKKSQETQQSDTDTMTRMVDGKGQNLDIRV